MTSPPAPLLPPPLLPSGFGAAPGLPPAPLSIEGERVFVLDQTRLPFAVEVLELRDLAEVVHAIRAMQIRGAPLIGAVAAFGVALALRTGASDADLDRALNLLAGTRPTAVNLHWALARMDRVLRSTAPGARPARGWKEALAIVAEDRAANAAIGAAGAALLRGLAPKGPRLVVATHCNAGALATCGLGTALAPLYAAARTRAVEVLVSETRPRNQGLLTAWELAAAGVPYRVVTDNGAGYLIASGAVDAVIVGADRIAANGDVANKVGTYLKALAARDAGIPFWVAAPLSTFDPATPTGADIPIEERAAAEVQEVHGVDGEGQPIVARLLGHTVPVANPAFDVTRAELVTGIICERGVFAPHALLAASGTGG